MADKKTLKPVHGFKREAGPRRLSFSPKEVQVIERKVREPEEKSRGKAKEEKTE